MALKIANLRGLQQFKASNTWLTRFKTFFSIHSREIYGEEGLVNPMVLEESYNEAKKILDKYDDKNIFNCDETGLFWKCTPTKTLVLGNEDKASGKTLKDRITILLCCSITEEKIKPLIIGKSKSPKRFQKHQFQKFECRIQK